MPCQACDLKALFVSHILLILIIGICSKEVTRSDPTLMTPFKWHVQNYHATCFGHYQFTPTRLFCIAVRGTTLESCKRTCEKNPLCGYIEFYWDSNYCAGFRTSCAEPKIIKQDASSHIFSRWRTRSTGYACGGETGKVFGEKNTTLDDCMRYCESNPTCVHLDFYLESENNGFCFGFRATCTNPHVRTGHKNAAASSYILPSAKLNHATKDKCRLRQDTVQIKGNAHGTVAAFQLCDESLSTWKNQSSVAEIYSPKQRHCPCPTCVMKSDAAPATYCTLGKTRVADDKQHRSVKRNLLERVLLRRWLHTTWTHPGVPLVVVASPWVQCAKGDLRSDMLTLFWVSSSLFIAHKICESHS